MKITQTAATKATGHENKTGSTQLPGNYKIGQILNAQVLSSSNQGQVKLRLNNVEIMASSKITLAQNAQLSLKVTQLQPQLILQVMPSSANTPLQDAKINLLPRQTSLAPLLAELAYKSQARETSTNQHTLKTTGTLLIAALATRNDIKQPDGLRRAIRQSGLFLEAKLATMTGNNPPDLSTDLKSLLLRYLNQLSQMQKTPTVNQQATPPPGSIKPQNSEISPPLKGRLPIKNPRATFSETTNSPTVDRASPDSLKKIQGALARLGLLQVATAESFDEGQRLWHLEIPVRQANAIETVSLTIEKKQHKHSQEKQENAAWTINLSLDLPSLGSLQSRINMDKQGLSTTFWSDSGKTLAIIESRLAELRTNFEQQGLQTHNLNCRSGQPPSAEATQADEPLINYRV